MVVFFLRVRGRAGIFFSSGGTIMLAGECLFQIQPPPSPLKWPPLPPLSNGHPLEWLIY